METYLTFHKIISLLQQYQESNPTLNSFGYGNLVDFGKNVSGSTVVYPFLFVIPQSISYDENTTTYQVTMIFADRLNETLDNEVDCISDQSLNARNFLSQIRRGDLQDYFDITLPQQAQPFMERFNDNVAGVALDANIIVYEDINACVQYPTPTPSNTPGASPQPTPTVTSTNTPTPSITPTMTRTPTNTPTFTPTPSTTPSQEINPNLYNALWWFDYTNASSLTVGGGSLQGAKNLATTGGFFSGSPALYPTWDATGYEGVSGATQAGVQGISNALGLFMGSYSAYTTFVRFNGDVNSTGNITQSDNDTNYLGQQQGYRWFSLSDYLGSPPDFVRAYTFNTAGNSWSEPDFAYSGGVWYNIAVRVFQTTNTSHLELWVDGVLVDATSENPSTIRTSTNPIFSLMSGFNYKTTEQFFIPSKLSDAEMAVMFNYLNNKY
jgi:hypothetical protein